MTIQPHETSPDYARQLTDRIRVAVEGTWQLIVEAYQSRAWAALGYSSWDDYCTREFGTSRLKLPREDRAEQVASLRESGLSIRAIASATGSSKNTVKSDLRQVGQNDPPQPSPKSDAELLAGAEWSPEAVEDEPRFTDEPGHIQPVTGTITGMDGKTYTRPEPKEHKPKAEAITSQFSSAIVDLNRLLDRFHRISTNENFQKNKSQIEALHGNDLARAISELQDLADQLN